VPRWPKLGGSRNGNSRNNDGRHLIREQGTGKPDDTETVTSGLGRGAGKVPHWQLADALLYFKHGSRSAWG